MIKRIISGGQSGIDSLAIVVARSFKIETGGTAPKGFLTEYGPTPKLAQYGLVEHTSPEYPPRTKQNILDSDGTLWLGDITSAGGKLTKSLVKAENRPWLDNPSIDEFIAWVLAYDIEVLNVAGNRYSKMNKATRLKYKKLFTSFLVKLFTIRLFQVDIGYACFGIESKDGVVIRAADIGKWMIGKSLQEIKPWLLKKNAIVKEVFYEH